MQETLNYQVIIDLVVLFLSLSVPIGIVFGITEKLLNLFYSMVFGDKNIRL